ncbi:MAG: hypothetical protein ACRDZY_09525, partial [Acidimicrobiales bacterium]
MLPLNAHRRSRGGVSSGEQSLVPPGPEAHFRPAAACARPSGAEEHGGDGAPGRDALAVSD